MPSKKIEPPKIFLDKVRLKGFKSIEDLSVDLQRGLNILIGKNGSGKSNFLEFLYQAIGINLKSDFFYNYVKIDLLSSDKHHFAIELERKSNKPARETIDDDAQLAEKFTIDGELKIDTETDKDLNHRFKFKEKQFVYRRNLAGIFTSMGYRYIYPTFIKFDLPETLTFIATAGVFRGNISVPYVDWIYSKTSYFINDVLWTIDRHFDDSSEKLLLATPSEIIEMFSVQEILKEKLKFYTTIEDVRFNPNINTYKDDKSFIIDNIKLDFKINGNWLPWSELSDGTKRLFYIISEVTFSNGLILIEEPELGVHPHQFNLLMDFLKEQSEEKQIIISTHSPKALDHLSPEELSNILITYFDLNKGTQIRHLTNAEIKKAKKYMKEVGFFSDYWLLSDLEE